MKFEARQICSKNKKLLVIVGPTGVGKTSLGIKLGKRFNGEIVSADSRQIYKYMDIGTGKELPVNPKFTNQNSKLQFKNKKYTVGFYKIDGSRVWMYDVITPDKRFSAVLYARIAKKVIANIWKRKKLSIIVGGTGFYIKSLLYGIDTARIPADWDSRDKLEKLRKNELQDILKKEDSKKFESMNISDKNNPRRLIRAIELAKAGAKIGRKGRFDERQKAGQKGLHGADVLKIGLKADKKILYERIDNRVNKRVEDGILLEIRKLIGKGYKWSNPGMDALGYKQWKPYFDGKADKKETIQRWKYDEHSYARRQLTWFEKDKKIIWYNIDKKGWSRRVSEKVKKWYDKNG